jgi:hypothetical protein
MPFAKYKYKDKPCKYYDNSCVFEESEIVDDKGKPLLSKPSFIRYEWATEILDVDIFKKRFEKIYTYKCKLTEVNLLKIQDGAKKSKEIKPIFKKYFSYF